MIPTATGAAVVMPTVTTMTVVHRPWLHTQARDHGATLEAKLVRLVPV